MTDKPTPKKQRKGARWSEHEALEAGERLGQGERVRQALDTAPSLSDALRRLGVAVSDAPAAPTGRKRGTRAQAENTAVATPDTDGARAPTAPKKKRQGAATKPIFHALDTTPARSRWGADWIALDFPGGRLLSYNELYSILQFRKYEAFRYKKICQKAVKRALDNPDQDPHGPARPFFNGPTRLTLLRIGAKALDREALPVIFKYFTDTLKSAGVIEDDNPDIIVDIQTLQDTGTERLAMRLDRIENWAAPALPHWNDWK